MKYWMWDSSLDLGIDMVDRQHRQIAEFINQLHEARLSKDTMLISTTIVGLIDYTITHFAFEEELIRRAGYPLLEGHQMAHAAFTQRIDTHRLAYENGKDVIADLLLELKMWLTQHINIEDKQYVPYVKKTLKKS